MFLGFGKVCDIIGESAASEAGTVPLFWMNDDDLCLFGGKLAADDEFHGAIRFRFDDIHHFPSMCVVFFN